MWKWAFAEIYGGTWRRGSMGPGCSSEQIKTANETLKYWNPTLICGAMEEEGIYRKIILILYTPFMH